MRTRSTLAALAALAILAAPAFAAGPFAQVDTGATSIDFRPQSAGIVMTLTVSGPDGYFFQQTYGAGEAASFSVFDAVGGFLPSGNYHWELRAAPELSDAQRDAMAEARATGADAGSLQKAGKLPKVVEPLFGAFRVDQGSIVAGDEVEASGSTPAPGGNRLAQKTQVIAMDLVVQGSECVGIDCTSSESFGFDTIRLKENNLRIKFEDTSVGSFPSTDWQLTANDSANGGANRFSIEDITAAKVPFTIEGGSASNTLYVDSAKRVGINTSTPVLQLHVRDGNTPALRLEQDNSSGFTAQTWDVAGNEANFFVRDATNGSKLPFRIEPGTPSSTVYLDSTGNVGIGTTSPSQRLHVLGTGAVALVEDPQTTEGARELVQLANNGTVTQRFTDTQGTTDTADDSAWISGVRTNNRFIITLLGTIGSPLWSMDSSGNVTATSFNPTSSRSLKQGFSAIEPKEVLDKVVALPISEWRYREDVTDSRHLGPVAEDFRDAFGLGADDRHISVTDLGGVSLAAIQGLNEVVTEKDRELQELRAEVAQLKAMVEKLAAADSAD